MRFPARSAAAWLLPLLLSGCIHKKAQISQAIPLAPPIEEPPPAIHIPPGNDLPPPEVTGSVQNRAPVVTPAPPPPKKAPKHKKPANTNTQQAANEGAAPVSAIGQLSSGDPPDVRQQTDASILATERQLNGINRQLSDQETKTAAQIREFLKQARAALTTGDIDGAHTLAVKAKVLLDELHP
jgi:hypothetical protein